MQVVKYDIMAHGAMKQHTSTWKHSAAKTKPTNHSGYASARLLSKLPSLNGTFAEPKSVSVSAVRAAAVRLSHAMSGCWPPRALVNPSLRRRKKPD